MTSSLVFADDDEGVSLESCAQPEKAVTDKAAISAFFFIVIIRASKLNWQDAASRGVNSRKPRKATCTGRSSGLGFVYQHSLLNTHRAMTSHLQ